MQERGSLVKDMTWHTTQLQRKNKSEGGRRRVSPSRLCGMTCLWTAAVFVNQDQGCLLDWFSERKEGRQGHEGKLQRTEKSRNSRKWVDPNRGGLCSLCGMNESSLFRTGERNRGISLASRLLMSRG